MEDLDRKRLTTRVLELLDASARAHAEGDWEKSNALMQEASELDPICVGAIDGGIRIGEIPHPHRDPQAWSEYVAAQRDGLARMEAAPLSQGGEV